MKIFDKIKMLKEIETIRVEALSKNKCVKAASILFNTKLQTGGVCFVEDSHEVSRKVISAEKAYRQFVDDCWKGRSKIENGDLDPAIIEELKEKLSEFGAFAERCENDIIEKVNAMVY